MFDIINAKLMKENIKQSLIIKKEGIYAV